MGSQEPLPGSHDNLAKGFTLLHVLDDGLFDCRFQLVE
jgi:hypothetical protein